MKNGQASGLSLVAMGILVFAVLGCSSLPKLSSSNSNAPQSNGIPGFGNNKTGATDPLTEKTNLYIKTCVNNYSERLISSYERYASWLKDVEAGPTGKETTVYGLYELNGDGQNCVDAINKAKTLEPDLPEVEANADKYAAVLKEAIGKVNEIYPYYDRDNYKDDNFARGKEFHPVLLKAFKDFEAANKTFLADVGKLEDEVAQNNLKEFEGKPESRFEYLVTAASIKSKKILEEIQQKDFDKLEIATLQPLIEDFEKNINELKTFSSADLSKRPMAGSYVSSSEDFLKATKDLMRRVRDKKPFDSSEIRHIQSGSGWMVDGSPDDVIRKYNDMISRQNSLQ